MCYSETCQRKAFCSKPDFFRVKWLKSVQDGIFSRNLEMGDTLFKESLNHTTWLKIPEMEEKPCILVNHHALLSYWSSYSDLTRREVSPLISGISRLVKYYSIWLVS